MEQEKVHVRLLILAGVALLWMTAVFGRLTYLQLIRHSDYLLRAAKQQRHTIEITPKRGAIYDRNMRPLAMSVPVQSAFAIPSEVKDVNLATRLISGALGMDAQDVREKLGSGSTFVWLQRKLTPDKVQALQSLNLKGIYFQEENQRFYSKREMAAHVLGFVDVDEKGLGGIEREYDDLIRGKGAKIIVMADAHQRFYDASPAQLDHGASVVLTLDEKIQYIAERELAVAIDKTHAPSGTIIVQDPNTGAILAMANWPHFNPNTPMQPNSVSRSNIAVSQMYEPGSTFKLITLSAALDQNLIRPEEEFNCENGSVIVAGHLIHDHKKYGVLTVADILANSSDVGAIKIALRLGEPKFFEYIKSFGFGTPTGIDLPSESRGLLSRLEHWGSFSIASVSMGQEVGVTPVQLVTAVSAVANGGLWNRPHLVQEVRKGDVLLPADARWAPTPARRVVRPETAATLRRLMEGVVLHGTGKQARLDGWTTAGKTGTAQKIDPDTGRYSPTAVIASFSGFAPINDPAITILVAIDSPAGWPHGGGDVAAPVFKRVAEQVLAYLNVPRDVPLSPRLMQASYRQPGAADTDESATDDLAAVNFSARPDAEDVASPAAEHKKLPITVAVEEGGDIAVPDFAGKTMREVTETSLRLGLEPVLLGSGLAGGQSPAAGSKVRRGTKMNVEFGGGSGRSNKPR